MHQICARAGVQSGRLFQDRARAEEPALEHDDDDGNCDDGRGDDNDDDGGGNDDDYDYSDDDDNGVDVVGIGHSDGHACGWALHGKVWNPSP